MVLDRSDGGEWVHLRLLFVVCDKLVLGPAAAGGDEGAEAVPHPGVGHEVQQGPDGVVAQLPKQRRGDHLRWLQLWEKRQKIRMTQKTL